MEKKIAVDINFSESSVEDLSHIISNNLSDKLIDTLKDDLKESFDLDSEIDEWADQHLDDRVESIIENSDWFVGAIRDEVVDKIEDMDLKDYLDVDTDYDYDSIAYDLLQNYSPMASCRTGEAFTDAVKSAIRFMLLKDSDFVLDIQKSLDRQKRKEMINEVRGTIIKETMEEMRGALRQEFISELQEYSSAIENAKALLNSGDRQIHPLDLNQDPTSFVNKSTTTNPNNQTTTWL